MKNTGFIHRGCASGRVQKYQRENADAEYKVGGFVQSAFAVNNHVEHMWVCIQDQDDENIHGTLHNDPEKIKSLKFGDSVSVSKAAVCNYMAPAGK